MTFKHLSWENFRSSIAIPGEQRVHRISTAPLMEIFSDGQMRRMGLLLQIPPRTEIPANLTKFAALSARILDYQGVPVLEVSTSMGLLEREFYHFALAVAERVGSEDQSVVAAITSEVECFSDLFREKSLLTTERQIGLLGELLILERLEDFMGLGALDAWIGPMGEPHDFRIGSHELEVKTTVSPERIHTINGVNQLVASSGFSLWLVSVMLAPAGAAVGFSLPSKIDGLSDRFRRAPDSRKRFLDTVRDLGYRDEERAHYERRFALRRPLAVAGVNSSFPAITQDVLQSGLGELASRVSSLSYDVNGEGLFHAEGSPMFSTVIPFP